MDSTIITTQAGWLMHDWIFNPLAEEYGLSADWDDRWRTGGMLEEVINEAYLSPPYLLAGIERFIKDRTGQNVWRGCGKGLRSDTTVEFYT